MLDFDFIEKYNHLLDLDIKQTSFIADGFLERMEFVISKYDPDYPSLVFSNPYGLFNPLTGEKLIEEGCAYYLDDSRDPVIYDGSFESLEYFFTKNIMSKDGRLLHRANDDANMVVGVKGSEKAREIITTMFTHAARIKLPIPYREIAGDKYFLLYKVVLNHFPSIAEEIAKDRMLSGNGLPIKLVRSDFYNILLQIYNDISAFFYSLTEYNPKGVYSIIISKNSAHIIDFGDYRILEWGLMKITNIFKNTDEDEIPHYRELYSLFEERVDRQIHFSDFEALIEHELKELKFKLKNR